MLNISHFLEKFSKKIESLDSYNRQIIEIIKNETGLDISPNNLEVKNCTVYINSTPGVKNKLFIYKESIIREIGLVTSVKVIDIK